MIHLNPNFKRLVDPNIKGPTITPRFARADVKIIKLFSQGLNTDEILEELGISRATFSIQRDKLFLRLGVKNSAELVAFSFRNGILK